MNTATIETRSAQSDNAVTRLHNYASGAKGGAVDLTITRQRNGSCTVRWSGNRGRGWMKGYVRTEKTEAAAFAFVEVKWFALVAWLEALEPAEHDGAAEAFSAQVASMR